MSSEQDDYWRARPDMPSEAPGWINRDYNEQDEQPKSRRWIILTTLLLSAFLAFGGLWGTIEPLFK